MKCKFRWCWRAGREKQHNIWWEHGTEKKDQDVGDWSFQQATENTWLLGES